MPTIAMTSLGLKELHDRKANVLGRRPALGHTTGQACVHMTEGFACDVHLEDRMLRADQPESEGGTGSGPHPEQLLRASLGACLAMGYRLWGTKLGTRIDSVDVEVFCEYDLRGQLGLSPDVPVGWEQILFHVAIVSPDPEPAVRRVVETADRLNPLLANLAPSLTRVHRLTVIAPRHQTL